MFNDENKQGNYGYKIRNDFSDDYNFFISSFTFNWKFEKNLKKFKIVNNKFF